MTTAYIAAPYAERALAILLMGTLESRGIEVTSTWLRVVDGITTHEERRRCADIDLADVRRADVLVALTLDAAAQPRMTYGEIGYALAMKMPVLWVGDVRGEPLLFDATGVTRLHSIEALLVVLGEMVLAGPPSPRSGITLAGWRCRWCGLFNSDEKELREECRGCGRAR